MRADGAVVSAPAAQQLAQLRAAKPVPRAKVEGGKVGARRRAAALCLQVQLAEQKRLADNLFYLGVFPHVAVEAKGVESAAILRMAAGGAKGRVAADTVAAAPSTPDTAINEAAAAHSHEKRHDEPASLRLASSAHFINSAAENELCRRARLRDDAAAPGTAAAAAAEHWRRSSSRSERKGSRWRRLEALHPNLCSDAPTAAVIVSLSIKRVDCVLDIPRALPQQRFGLRWAATSDATHAAHERRF